MTTTEKEKILLAKLKNKVVLTMLEEYCAEEKRLLDLDPHDSLEYLNDRRETVLNLVQLFTECSDDMLQDVYQEMYMDAIGIAD